MESESASSTVEALRKKERHEDTKEGRTLSKRLVNKADDRWPTSKPNM
jgi:hypothetical protein